MKVCEQCGENYTKRPSEAHWQYDERRFCGKRCTGLALNPRKPAGEFSRRRASSAAARSPRTRRSAHGRRPAALSASPRSCPSAMRRGRRRERPTTSRRSYAHVALRPRPSHDRKTPVNTTDFTRQDGLCAETDPDLFFPDDGDTRTAKAVCARCHILTTCRNYAIEHGERWGVWGGLSARELKAATRASASARTPHALT